MRCCTTYTLYCILRRSIVPPTHQVDPHSLSRRWLFTVPLKAGTMYSMPL